MIRYGTNPIAWSNDDDQTLGAEISLEQCLSEAGEIGFDGIENGHKFPSTAPELSAALAPHGLRFVSAWYSMQVLARTLEEEIEALDAHLDLLLAMGCNVCIACECSNSIHGAPETPISAKPTLQDDAAWRSFAEKVEAVARHCEARGAPMAYHHHMGTVVQTPEEIDRFMAETGPATRLLFDTGHCFFGGGDPEAVLARHVDRVVHFHAKNVRAAIMRRAQEEDLSFLEAVRLGVFTVPGDTDGAVAFEPCLQTLAAARYQGWLVIEAEQDPAVRNPHQYQSLGLASLKAMAREVGLGDAR